MFPRTLALLLLLPVAIGCSQTPVRQANYGGAGTFPAPAMTTAGREAAGPRTVQAAELARATTVTASLAYPPSLYRGTSAPSSAPVVLRFSAPVDRAAAEGALQVRALVEGSERNAGPGSYLSPPLAGSFSWPDDRTMLFRPLTLLSPGPYEVNLGPLSPNVVWDHSGEGQRFRVAIGNGPMPLVRTVTFADGPIAAATEYVGTPPEALSGVIRAVHQGSKLYLLDNHPAGLVAIFDEPSGRLLKRIIPVAELPALDGRSLDMAVGPDGAIFILLGGSGPSRIYRYRADGTWGWMTELRDGADRVVVSGPWLYLHRRGSKEIYLIDRQSGRLVRSLTVPGLTGPELPEGIAEGPGSTLFVIGWGRLFQITPEGEILWGHDHRVMSFEDLEGDENLHNLPGSKSGSGYPSTLIPSMNGGVWVQDTRWFKEFRPGEGLVARRKPGGPAVGVCPTEGGFYVQQPYGLAAERPEGRYRVLGDWSGGPGGFEGASLVVATDGGFQLYDRLAYTLRQYHLDGSTVGDPLYGVERAFLATDHRLWSAPGPTTLQPLDGSGQAVTLEGAMTHWKLLPSPTGIWGLIADREVGLWSPSGALRKRWPLQGDRTTIYANAEIALLPDGRAVVLRGSRIFVIDPGSDEVTDWGMPGDAPEQLGEQIVEERLRYAYGPGGLAVSREGLLIIADHLNGALKGFTPEGILRWSVALPDGPASLHGVERLIIDARGDLWAVSGKRLVRYVLR